MFGLIHLVLHIFIFSSALWYCNWILRLLNLITHRLYELPQIICKNANFKPLNGCEVRGMQSGAISRRTESRARKVCVNKHEKQKIGQQFGFCHRHDDSFPGSLIWGSILYFYFSWDFSRLKDPIFFISDAWCSAYNHKDQDTHWVSLLLVQYSVQTSGTKALSKSAKQQTHHDLKYEILWLA